MNIFFNFLVDKSKLFIFFLIVLSLISLLGLPKFQLDASSDTLLLDNDPDLKTYRENSRKYGSSDFLVIAFTPNKDCLLYTSPSPRDVHLSRMPSSA